MTKRNILVIAVHADDETLGCGGTLVKAKKEEDHNIHWLILTKTDPRMKDCVEQVQKLYEFTTVHQLGFDAAKLDTVPRVDLINAIGKVFNDIQPDTVFLPFYGDVHSDHRVAFEAAYPCTKPFRYPFVNCVCMMEILSETDFAPALQINAFTPNFFVDITLI